MNPQDEADHQQYPMDAECEARGCDIPSGYAECRRCGAELVEWDGDE